MHAIYCKLAVVAIMLLCAAGCEEWKALMAQGASVDLDATFRNESSATVSIGSHPLLSESSAVGQYRDHFCNTFCYAQTDSVPLPTKPNGTE